MEDAIIPGQHGTATSPSTGVKVVDLLGLEDSDFTAYQGSVDMAREIATGSERRSNIPVRDSFVLRRPDGRDAPLAQIVGRGGRGGGLAAKLYVALIWRCAAPPYTTDISARKWASLLALEDPNHKGARRVAKALTLLKDLQLISLVHHRGEPSEITLLDESGDGTPYVPAPTANKSQHSPRDRYFKLSVALWTDERAYVQRMSSPAFAMLLVLLQAGSGRPGSTLTEGTEVWWSTEIFPNRYGLSPAMRSRGTRDLIDLGLLYVRRQAVGQAGSNKSFTREKVRNVYRLQNTALHLHPDAGPTLRVLESMVPKAPKLKLKKVRKTGRRPGISSQGKK